MTHQRLPHEHHGLLTMHVCLDCGLPSSRQMLCRSLHETTFMELVPAQLARERDALIEAVNAYLDNDGSRGDFDAHERRLARERLDELLAASPSPVSPAGRGERDG